MSKTNDTSDDDVLPDSQLDTVVGGHKAGPTNYGKKNGTTISVVAAKYPNLAEKDFVVEY